MKQIEKFEKLTAGQNVNNIIEKVDRLSTKGQKLFAERIEEEYNKLSKVNKAKRPAKIEVIVDELLEKYLRKDLRPAKEKVDRRLTVLQINGLDADEDFRPGSKRSGGGNADRCEEHAKSTKQFSHSIFILSQN